MHSMVSHLLLLVLTSSPSFIIQFWGKGEVPDTFNVSDQTGGNELKYLNSNNGSRVKIWTFKWNS